MNMVFESEGLFSKQMSEEPRYIGSELTVQNCLSLMNQMNQMVFLKNSSSL